MSLFARLAAIVVLLSATLAVQIGLNGHMRSASQLEYAVLKKPFSNLPSAFVVTTERPTAAPSITWLGKSNQNEELIRKELPFAVDDLIHREYVTSDGKVSLALYMVHSREGRDRKHHPEICIRDVTGAPEDHSARKIIFVDAEQQRPIQRFRFRTSATHHTMVYYWHYTLPRVPRAGETALQVLYQRINKPAPSVTVQVSLTAEVDQVEPVEKGFLVYLDQAMRNDHLPEGTVMACDRVPIALRTRE